MPADAVRLAISSRRDEASAAVSRIMKDVCAAGYGKACCFAIRLALEEAVSNALRHGNADHADTGLTIEYHVGPQQVTIAIEDSGPGFDPESVPDPTLDENLENPSGRGLMLMRAYMTEVTFNERGNRVCLVYERPLD